MKSAATLYLRSSKDRSDVSIDAQRRELRELAQARGLVVVSEFVDAVESGKDEQRPGFQALLRELKAPNRQWQTIMALDTSRIGRRQYIAQAFAHECDKMGVAVIYAKVPEVDPITKVLLHSILTAMDEVHSLMSREKGLAGMAENVRQGYRAGGRAPKGYRLVRVATGAVRDGDPVTKSRLETDEEAQAIGEYLKARAKGQRSREICERLALTHSSATLQSIEANALVYAGHTVWNVHQPRKGNGQAKRRPREEWIIQRGTHDALITDEEAEAILAGRAAKSRVRRVRGADYLLSGVLVTPAGTAWHGNSRMGTGYYRAGTKSLLAERVEREILEAIMADLVSPGLVSSVTRQARARMRPDAARAEMAELESRVRRNEAESARLLELVTQTSTPAPLLRKVEQLEADTAEARLELAEHAATLATAKAYSEITEDQVRHLLGTIAEQTRESGRMEVKQFVAGLVEKITLDPETLSCGISYRIALESGVKLASPRGSNLIPAFAHHRQFTLLPGKRGVKPGLKKAA